MEITELKRFNKALKGEVIVGRVYDNDYHRTIYGVDWNYSDSPRRTYIIFGEDSEGRSKNIVDWLSERQLEDLILNGSVEGLGWNLSLEGFQKKQESKEINWEQRTWEMAMKEYVGDNTLSSEECIEEARKSAKRYRMLMGLSYENNENQQEQIDWEQRTWNLMMDLSVDCSRGSDTTFQAVSFVNEYRKNMKL